MFKMTNQFSYIVTDTNSRDFDMMPYFAMAKEGFNLAFIYNMSNSQPGANCPSGVQCIAEEIGNILGSGFEMTLRLEIPLFQQYSLEEFNLMRDRPSERHRKVISNFKSYMENNGRCNNCTRWGMEAVESKDAGQVEILDVGIWTPAGSNLKDDLQPHIKGNFRGRRIPVASVEVRAETCL